jgi:DNA-binding beta-propeller fold protein YncE/mono/diheme cytochrome c family protein
MKENTLTTDTKTLGPSEGMCGAGARVAGVLAGLILLITAGCGGTKTNSPVDDPDKEPGTTAVLPLVEGCASEQALAQAKSRHVAGNIIYLPLQSANCQPQTWALASFPSEESNTIQVGTDGFARFTPLTPGAYQFESSLGDVRTLTVVPASQAPFENFNYFAQSSIAKVGSEIWVANLFTPSLTRFNPVSMDSLGEIGVGPWPSSLAVSEQLHLALVLHKAGDTLGFIDTKTNRLIDSLWIGDEPADIVVSLDGQRAYIALPLAHSVAVVDLVGRAVLMRVPTVADPSSLALSPNGDRVYVLSRRMSYPDRAPERLPAGLTVINTSDNTVIKTLPPVGSLARGIAFSPDGKLYVSTVFSDPSIASLADPSSRPFVYAVVEIDAESGSEIRRAEFSDRLSPALPLVNLHDIVIKDSRLWVVSESNDLVVELDRATLTETARLPVSGRVRSLLVDENGLWAHGAQRFVLTRLPTDESGSAPQTVPTGSDPRPEAVATGLAYFTGPGSSTAGVAGPFGVDGRSWSCSSCHVDGLSDQNNWQVGPVKIFETPRPMVLLEGTYSLGWQAYLSSARNFAFETNTNVGSFPSTENAEGLAAYLYSIMAPPAANDTTQRDGELSLTAQEGGKLFVQKGCAGCHGGSLYTSRISFARGVTDGVSDTPTLIGAYRNGTWFRHGEGRNLADAVLQMASYAGVSLSEPEGASIASYLGELTGRDFFLLASYPLDQKNAPVDRAHSDRNTQPKPLGVEETPYVVYSQAVLNSEINLNRLRLFQGDAEVPISRRVEGNRVYLEPTDGRLRYAATYRIQVDAGFESFRERTTASPTSITFRTAAAPFLAFDGTYILLMKMRGPGGSVSESRATVSAQRNTHGADLRVTYSYGPMQLDYATVAVVNGRVMYIPPLPVPAGRGGSFAEALSGLETSELNDENGDGIIDSARGVFLLTGPGIRMPGTEFSLMRAEQSVSPGPIRP